MEALFAGLLTFLGATPVAAPPPPVVAIEVYMSDEKPHEWLRSHGGAGWLDCSGRLVTAGHLGRGGPFPVDIHGGGHAVIDRLPGQVVDGLARGPCSGVSAQRLHRACEAFVGQEYVWWGVDDRWHPEHATVVAVEVLDHEIVTTLARGMAPGDSGSPLLDPQGAVVGTLTHINHRNRTARFAR